MFRCVSECVSSLHCTLSVYGLKMMLNAVYASVCVSNALLHLNILAKMNGNRLDVVARFGLAHLRSQWSWRLFYKLFNTIRIELNAHSTCAIYSLSLLYFDVILRSFRFLLCVLCSNHSCSCVCVWIAYVWIYECILCKLFVRLDVRFSIENGTQEAKFHTNLENWSFAVSERYAPNERLFRKPGK